MEEVMVSIQSSLTKNGDLVNMFKFSLHNELLEIILKIQSRKSLNMKEKRARQSNNVLTKMLKKKWDEMIGEVMDEMELGYKKEDPLFDISRLANVESMLRK